MDVAELKGKLVAVLGYAQEGRAVTKYLMDHGIKPVLFDVTPWEEWPKEVQEEIQALGVTVVFGSGYLGELKGYDVAFRSPGIPRLTPEIVEQEQKGMLLTSQTKWFFDHCPAKIIGITGTNGKGTTASLIYEMLAPTRYLTGNIGKQQPLEFLDNLKPDDWVVYELSSFQLHDLEKSPNIAVVLTVTPDHLDKHASTEEYFAAKESITKYQSMADAAVIFKDNLASARIGALGQGKKYYFSKHNTSEASAYIENDSVFISLNAGTSELLVKSQDLKIRGEHNLQNVCAASLAALFAGADIKTVKTVVCGFKGLPHRLEFVGEFSGVKFYDDSVATTPDPSMAAIGSFTEPLVLILGGSHKGSDFSNLAQKIASKQNIRGVILVGQEALRIKAALKAAGYNGQLYEGASSMAEIFQQIKTIAKSGDVVLLSPACASFGMFKGYADRGDQFQNWARNF